jgi:hypothetical protein
MQSVGGQTPINFTNDSTADDCRRSHPTASIAFRSRAGGASSPNGPDPKVKRLPTGFNPAAPSGEEIVFAEEGVLNIQLRERVSGLWIVNVATGEKRRYAGDAGSRSGHLTAIPSRGGLPRRQRDIATMPAAGGVRSS